MGCSLSGLNALYDVVATRQEIYVNNRKLEVIQMLGEGGYAFVYLVKELSNPHDDKGSPSKQTYVSRDGTYALKKVVIQTEEQLEQVKTEIEACSRFAHPNLLPLLDHSIIPVQKEGRVGKEAYLLFPVFKEGTLQDAIGWITQKDSKPRERYSPLKVLNIFLQISQGLSSMHHSTPPYCHNDLKPGNVLLGRRRGETLAVIMDFGSTRPAMRVVRNRGQAMTLQEWAAQHCSAPYRAPELWDCPSIADVDEKADIWSLGCTLYAIMHGQSPFEYSLGESGGSLQLAVMSGQIKWPSEGSGLYPDSFQQLVSWMLQTNPTLRPNVDDVITHVEKLIDKLKLSEIGRGEM